MSRVVESKHSDFAVGDYVLGKLGWVSHAICVPRTPSTDYFSFTAAAKLHPSIPDNRRSAAIGALGMPG